MNNIHEEVANAILEGGDWWFNFEWFNEDYYDSWYSCLSSRVLFEALATPNYTVRKKKRYININGTEVPEPVRKPLKRGEAYYIADLTDEHTDIMTWQDDQFDQLYLDRGLIHINFDDQQAHIQALIKANGC